MKRLRGVCNNYKFFNENRQYVIFIYLFFCVRLTVLCMSVTRCSASVRDRRDVCVNCTALRPPVNSKLSNEFGKRKGYNNYKSGQNQELLPRTSSMNGNYAQRNEYITVLATNASRLPV